MFFTIWPSDLLQMVLIGHFHCTLYYSVNWSSLYTRRKTHWLMLIYKHSPLSEISTAALILYIQHLFCQSHSVKGPQSTHTSLGRTYFQFAAASVWSELQKTLRLDRFISISSFKGSITDTLPHSCGCFVWCIVVSTFLPFVLLSVPNNVCTMFCSAAMLCCYHVVVMCCYHAMLLSWVSLYVVLWCLLSWCVLSYI
jgi:hypothetical protein